MRSRHSYGWFSIFVLLSFVIILSYHHPKADAVDGNPARAEELWEETCSFCHSQETLHGKTAADIRKAFEEVEVMQGFREDVSDDGIEMLGTLLSGEPQAVKYKYITARACRTCHPEQYKQWQHSLLAQSHFEPVYNFYFIKASKDSDQKLETFCAACHTPIAVLNGNIPFPNPVTKPEDTKVSDVENEGIQCDFCHMIDGVKETRNSGYTVKPSRTKLGPYADSVSSFHGTAFSPLFKSSDLCGTCHDVTHPVNGILLEATYTEWKESPYAEEGVTCQDCHMTEGLTAKKLHPGKAGVGGPEREHVSKHYFVGPNLIYANAPGAEKLKKLSERLLRSSATVEIGSPTKTKDGFNLPVMVTNTGAGHYLPTGVTELRQLWLEIIATDEAGHEVFHSGGLDEHGNISEGAIIYFTDVIDKTGASTTQFWNAVKKVSDKRIPPRETVTEVVRVKTGDTDGPITVEVALHYRSVSPRGLAEVGIPADLVDIPIFTIARTTGTVELK